MHVDYEQAQGAIWALKNNLPDESSWFNDVTEKIVREMAGRKDMQWFSVMRGDKENTMHNDAFKTMFARKLKQFVKGYEPFGVYPRYEDPTYVHIMPKPERTKNAVCRGAKSVARDYSRNAVGRIPRRK